MNSFKTMISLFVILFSMSNHRIVKANDFSDVLFEEFLEFLQQKSEVKVTVPLTNDQLNQMIDALAEIDHKTCALFESCSRKWMIFYNEIATRISERGSILSYNYATNMTDENDALYQEYVPIENRFSKKTLKVAKYFKKFNTNWDTNLQRQFKFASSGYLIEDPKEAVEVSTLISNMEKIYATGEVCIFGECLSLDPGLTNIMKKSRDYETLETVWKDWRKQTGPKMKSNFTRVIDIENKYAKKSGYTDLSEVWLNDYEEKGFDKVMDDIFEKELKPLYEQLHMYVRRKLKKFYESKYPETDLIPAHILGNMWAQSWESIFDIVAPFPNVTTLNIDNKLIEKSYTPKSLFKESERFFTSIGLYEMTPTFWEYSMIKRPKDRVVQCHASAWDNSNTFDFRIKMCTKVDQSDFQTIHHEMGHTEYQMAYKDLPAVFRSGANSGFHEAIGDTIALAVMTPKHLKTIGLIENDQQTKEQEINNLMKTALNKIAFIPFGYLMDKWRFEVFRGKINETNYNEKWWEMRKQYQGVEAPVSRSENDFDPGSKYHIPSFVPYSRYFVSHILQFQFYKALCDLSGHKGALHKCDFYESKKAGGKLREMLELGSSKHWKVALKLLTGEENMSAKALFEYFEPLIKWLIKENKKFPEDKPGW